MAKATIYDVAGAAKVSLATVSRVLNTPDKVKPETRKKVLDVIKQLGYRPNAIARGLASKKSTSIGVVLSDVTRASTSQLLGGIIDNANKYGYSIKLFSVEAGDSLSEDISKVISEQVDGVLFLNDEITAEEMVLVHERFAEVNIPVVLTNSVSDVEYIPSVSIDYRLSSYEYTKSLIEKGRKNIYLLTTVRGFTTNYEKEEGFIKAMTEHNLEPNVLRVTGGDLAKGYYQMYDHFKENPVDAAIAVRDSIAVNFINVMRELDKVVPDDVEITGYQNTKYAILSRPALTCIENPVYEIGAKSMKLLTRYMKNEPVEEHKVMLAHTVIKRNTTT